MLDRKTVVSSTEIASGENSVKNSSVLAATPPLPQPVVPAVGASLSEASASAVTRSAWLVVLDGPHRGRMYALPGRPFRIGRLPDNDIVLPDSFVSSHHAQIKVEVSSSGEPTFKLIDLNSRNGTFVGHRAVYRAKSRQVFQKILKDGDQMLLGRTTIGFRCM